MNIISKAFLTVISTSAIVVLTGCFGGGGIGSGEPYTRITTHATINGVYAAWAGASVSGNASPGTFGCDPVNNGRCRVNFGGPNYPVNTNPSGQYDLYSDALGGVQWTFAAGDAPNTNICPNGASETDIAPVSGNTDLYCNQLNGLAVNASPSTCNMTTNADTGAVTTNCPNSITISASRAIFPTGRAITMSNYNTAEAQQSTGNVSADSSTSITVPTPTTPGYSAVVFVDPITHLVIGAAPFDLKAVTVGGCIPSPNRQCQ